MRFSKEPRRESRGHMLSIRMTNEQAEALQQIADGLGISGGKAEVVRRAIDFWIENDRAVRAILRPRRGEK